jgi:hypothetical protein
MVGNAWKKPDVEEEAVRDLLAILGTGETENEKFFFLQYHKKEMRDV